MLMQEKKTGKKRKFLMDLQSALNASTVFGEVYKQKNPEQFARQSADGIWTTSPEGVRWESNDPGKPEQACYWCSDMVSVGGGYVTVSSAQESGHECSKGICPAEGRFTSGIETRAIAEGEDSETSNKGQADDLLFAQAFCTLAEENGLGTCILGTTVFNPEMIIRILELPPLVVPVLTVAAGYPDEWPEQTDRLPEEGIIHREKYTCFSAGQIDMIYAQKEALPESRHFVQINGTENLAQVFTRYRFTRKDNEEMSRKMLEVLKDQGFLGDLTQHDKVQ